MAKEGGGGGMSNYFIGAKVFSKEGGLDRLDPPPWICPTPKMRPPDVRIIRTLQLVPRVPNRAIGVGQIKSLL